MRQTLKIAVTVLVVATLGMSGIALAQTDDGVATDAANEAAVTRIGEQLAPLVEDGTITQAQADAVAETLAENFRGGPRGHHRRMHIGAEVAEFLGMEPEALREALQDGSTLAEIAQANGSSADALIDHLVANAQEKLDEKVAEGEITQAEADEKLAEITEKVTDLVNGEAPLRGRGGPPPEGDDA
jgi:uncharacterized protein YidB (DUF937 family)